MTGEPGKAGRRVVHLRFGDPADVLKVEDLPAARPPLRPGDVRIRVRRVAIHPGDLQLIAGAYGGAGDGIPGGRVPGTEGCGIVEEVGEGASNIVATGQRVAFFAGSAWQGSVVAPADAVVPIADEVGDDVAAQALTNTITARHVLRAGIAAIGATPSYLVQTGAASSTGRLVTAFALEAGIHPIRLVRSATSAARLLDLLPGGDIVDTSAGDWVGHVVERTGNAVPLIVDAAGGPLLAELLHILSRGGVILSYGLLDGRPADLKGVLGKLATLRGVSIATWRTDTAAEDRAADLAAGARIARDRPALFGSPPAFALADLGAAIRAATDPAKAGTIILAF